MLHTVAECSIHEITRIIGTTSRTLRHYHQIGLLPPSRIGANSYRYYNADALVRLQRILLLRELRLGLAAVGEILNGAAGQKQFQAEQAQIAADFITADEADLDPASDLVRAITARHHRWLSSPVMTVTKPYFLGLADMYVSDPRFGANYTRGVSPKLSPIVAAPNTSATRCAYTPTLPRLRRSPTAEAPYPASAAQVAG